MALRFPQRLAQTLHHPVFRFMAVARFPAKLLINPENAGWPVTAQLLVNLSLIHI